MPKVLLSKTSHRNTNAFQVPALSENENKIIKEGSSFVTGCHLNGTHSDSDVLNANI